MIKIHAFNTGRRYTEHGQRIAWAVLSTGNIAMVDVDRHIDYILVGGDLRTNSDILAHYDSHAEAPFNLAEREEFKALESELEAAALAVPAK